MAVHADAAQQAKALLEGRGVQVSDIVSIDRDSILYLGSLPPGQPKTAWLHRSSRGETKVVRLQHGFVAEPPPGLHDEFPE